MSEYKNLGDVISEALIEEMHQRAHELEILLGEAMNLQDFDKLDRLHVCSFVDGSPPGVASYVRAH
jgi:hypothetical protein